MATLAEILPQAVFYSLAGLACLGALFMALTKNVVRAIMALLGVVVCVAGLMFCLGAEAAGTAQLMVYAGGVMVLMIFGLSITEAQPGGVYEARKYEVLSSGLLVAALSIMAYRVLLKPWMHFKGPAPEGNEASSMIGAGHELLLHHSVALELSAVLLLVALAFGTLAIREGMKES